MEAFRNIAADSQGDYSAVIHLELVEKFKLASPEKEPYPWQINVSEALIFDLDCLVIAGTGAGKMMPFVMPLLVDTNQLEMVIIIISSNRNR